MSAQTKIKTRCPVCKAAYAVPHNSVGHRARCPKCDSVFRVVIPGVQQPAKDSARTPDAVKPRMPEAAARRPAEVEARRSRSRNGDGASDEDIVAWLMEGSERDDVIEQPRRWQPPPTPPAEPPQKASA